MQKSTPKVWCQIWDYVREILGSLKRSTRANYYFFHLLTIRILYLITLLDERVRFADNIVKSQFGSARRDASISVPGEILVPNLCALVCMHAFAENAHCALRYGILRVCIRETWSRMNKNIAHSICGNLIKLVTYSGAHLWLLQLVSIEDCRLFCIVRRFIVHFTKLIRHQGSSLCMFVSLHD